MRDEDDMRWATAVREAGHVVVAWAFGLHVQAIYLAGSGEGRSEIECDARAPLLHQIAVAEAGMVAAELLSAPTWPQAGMTDALKVMGLLEHSPDTTCESVEGRRCASQILASRVVLLRDLAIAVDRSGSLSGADLEGFAGRCPREKSSLAA